MSELSPIDSPGAVSAPHFEIDLHKASSHVRSFDLGAAAADATLHAESSQALRAEIENPPPLPIEIIAQQGLLVEVLRRVRTL